MGKLAKKKARRPAKRNGMSGKKKAVTKKAHTPKKPAKELTWEERADKAIALMDEWMKDESGYDEETWPELKEALERNTGRKLFHD